MITNISISPRKRLRNQRKAFFLQYIRNVYISLSDVRTQDCSIRHSLKQFFIVSVQNTFSYMREDAFSKVIILSRKKSNTFISAVLSGCIAV